MSDFSLTPEQNQVVELRDGKVVVTAAAGSGKTRVLTQRYVAHVVEDGLRPDQILTITFTKKAAANMKGRIVSELTKRGRMFDAQAAETGPIQTIHSFCQNMLRENSLAAGLDPEFEIISTDQALIAEAVWQAMLEAEDDPHAYAYIQRVAGNTEYRSSNHALLQSHVQEVLDELRSSGAFAGDVEMLYQSPEHIRAHWDKCLWESVPMEVKANCAPTGGALSTRLTEAYKLTKGFPKPPFLTSSDAADQEAAEFTAGLMAIVTRAWRRLEAEMRRRQELDFTALEALAVRLLQDSPATAARLRRQYRVLLVDEAQDVNPTQYRLLDGLGIDREMFVGDAQQSIYGFRQADVELFEERAMRVENRQLSQNFRSEPGILRFVDEVFRNQWGDRYRPMHQAGDVIDFEEMTQRRFDGVELWVQPQLDSEQVAIHIKQLLDEPGVRRKDIAVLTQTSFVAGRILEALTNRHVPARLAGGAELYYTRMEVRDVANILQALSDPTDKFALLATLRGPAVQVSADALVILGCLLAGDGDVEETLRAVALPSADDRAKVDQFMAWYLPLSQFADRLAAWEVMSEMFRESPFLANLAQRPGARQRVANARKLLNLAVQAPDEGPADFAMRVREIQRLRHKEGDAPADDEKEDLVTIMTVHKAKGLEWPIVIFPDTFRELSKKSEDLFDVVVDGKALLVATATGPARSMPYRWLSYRKRERETQERWRVLYVALTRAEKRLCVVVSPGAARENFATRIPKLVGFKRDAAPGGIRVRSAEEM